MIIHSLSSCIQVALDCMYVGAFVCDRHSHHETYASVGML